MTTESLVLSLAILSSSFWGSWHCAAMCTPVASLMTKKRTLLGYHIGRGISYTLLGAIGGFIGSFFLQNDFYYIRLGAGILFAVVLITMGINILIYNRPLSFPKLIGLKRFVSMDSPGYYLGFLSAFLPCGWLYSYVFASVATQSTGGGAFVMFLFWTGTLPALSAISVFMKRACRLAPAHKHMVAGLILVTAGVYTIASFFFFSA